MLQNISLNTDDSVFKPSCQCPQNAQQPLFELNAMDEWVISNILPLFSNVLSYSDKISYMWAVPLYCRPALLLYFNNQLFMKCLQKPRRKSPSLSFAVTSETSSSSVFFFWERYGASWRRPSWSRQTSLFYPPPERSGLMTELLHTGESEQTEMLISTRW